jgi:hypothetical protein
VIDFRDGRSAFGDEFIDLIELLERRNTGYSGQEIIEVIVYAESRRHRRDNYVQLLDDRRRVISEGSLSKRGYVSLPVHDRYQRAAYLHFENDVLLNRIEVLTEKHGRAHKHEEALPPKNDIKIGEFVKTNYKPEVKRFSFRQGGFSRINFRVHIGEQYGVIVNSIFIFANGSKAGGKTVGARLSEGDNEFSLNVPENATDIQVSFAHGQGSSVQVFLLR